MAITEKQKRFVDEYIIDFNGTQAAIRSGFSEKTANEQASRLLANVNIQNLVSERIKAREERTHITQDRVLLEIARLAFNDPRKAFDENDRLLPVKQWPDEVAAAISSIKITEVKRNNEEDTETYLKEIKFWDKGRQVELAGKYLGMFTDKVDLTGNVKLVLDNLDSKL